MHTEVFYGKGGILCLQFTLTEVRKTLLMREDKSNIAKCYHWGNLSKYRNSLYYSYNSVSQKLCQNKIFK